MSRRHSDLRRPSPLLVGVALLAALAACQAGLEERPEPKPLPVRAQAIEPGPFAASLTLLGVVRPAETVPVQCPAAGTLSYPERFARGLQTGAAVTAGEPLARLDSPQVGGAARLGRIEAEGARTELERIRSAVHTQALPAAELTRAEVNDRLAREKLSLAEAAARRLVLHAPRSGHLVVTRIYPPGADVTAGTELAEVAAEGAARVEAWAAASDRERLRPGLEVDLGSGDGTTPAGHGRLLEVAAVVDAAGTVRVVAEVTESRSLPAPGEGLTLIVKLDPRSEALTVPEEAVVLGSDGASLFLLDAAQGSGGRVRARRVPVTTGGRGGGRVEVVRGLDPGERVIVSGVAFLEDGAAVTDIPAEGR